jgi:hypothetical protein
VRCFIVIPACNEAGWWARSFAQVRVAWTRCRRGGRRLVDATGAEARDAGAVVLTHAINRGQGAALQTGMEYALGPGRRRRS